MITADDLDRAVSICSHEYISDPNLFLFQIMPEIAAEVRRLRRELMCDVCAGTGKIPNGECVCGGTGRCSDGFANLREDYQLREAQVEGVTERLRHTEAEIQRLKAENEALRKEHEAAKALAIHIDHNAMALVQQELKRRGLDQHYGVAILKRLPQESGGMALADIAWAVAAMPLPEQIAAAVEVMECKPLTDRAKELAQELVDRKGVYSPYVEAQRAFLLFGSQVAEVCAANTYPDCAFQMALAAELRKAAEGQPATKAGDAK